MIQHERLQCLLLVLHFLGNTAFVNLHSRHHAHHGCLLPRRPRVAPFPMSPTESGPQAIRKCRSVHDVVWVLTSDDSLHSAAAALRRMVDLTTGRRVSDADRAAAHEKIPVLLEIVSQAVMLDVR